jgi:hypothetical protein
MENCKNWSTHGMAIVTIATTTISAIGPFVTRTETTIGTIGPFVAGMVMGGIQLWCRPIER